jgi:hypothetical protein
VVQAYFVRNAGNGIHLPREDFTVAHCRWALEALLAPGSLPRTLAERIGRSYRARDGARLASERILAVAGAART